MPLAVAMVVDVERKPPQNLLYVMARGVFELHSPLEPIISWDTRWLKGLWVVPRAPKTVSFPPK